MHLENFINSSAFTKQIVSSQGDCVQKKSGKKDARLSDIRLHWINVGNHLQIPSIAQFVYQILKNKKLD